MLPGSGGLSIFSTEYLTSAAVTSLPLWNRTPFFSVQRICVLFRISNFSARAGRTFRFRSHSTSESYANSLAQWFAVRIPPNGATCAGSDSSPQTSLPPRLIGVARVPLRRRLRSPGERACGDGSCSDRTCFLQQLSTVELAPGRAIGRTFV